jgi:two-component system OmpR family response regulator
MRLLLVEDDRMLARGIASALSQSGYAVDVAATSDEAMRVVRGAEYAIGILDLGLPDGDGLDLLRAWRREGHDFPVLILSARAHLDHRIRGLDSGADDYLVKPFALREIEARLRALLRRPRERAPAAELGRLRFDRVGRRALVEGREIELTRRELDVLDMLIARAGRVVGKRNLLDRVFPLDADVGPNALEVHVSRLRQKLRPAGLTIRSLRGLGYRLEELQEDGDGDA